VREVSAHLPWPALLLGSAALLLWSSPREAVSRRAGALRWSAGQAPSGSPSGGRPGRSATSGGSRWLLAGAAGLAVGVLVGGVTGSGLAIGVTLGGERLLRGADDRQGLGRALVRDLPAACELLGVGLGAGMPVAGALAAVGEATPLPLGPALRSVAALYRMGADPRGAWAEVPSELAALGRVLVRAGESGSTVAPALRALAADSRSAARAATEAAVRRAGVWILAPLGLCFLPAFLCLGVVPLILGIAGDVFP
jgi:Flp pilus assembly protein TadB